MHWRNKKKTHKTKNISELTLWTWTIQRIGFPDLDLHSWRAFLLRHNTYFFGTRPGGSWPALSSSRQGDPATLTNDSDCPVCQTTLRWRKSKVRNRTKHTYDGRGTIHDNSPATVEKNSRFAGDILLTMHCIWAGSVQPGIILFLQNSSKPSGVGHPAEKKKKT